MKTKFISILLLLALTTFSSSDETVEQVSPEPKLLVITLQYITPEVLVEAQKQLDMIDEVRLTIDRRTNSVVFRGSDNELAAITALAEELDRAAPNPPPAKASPRKKPNDYSKATPVGVRVEQANLIGLKLELAKRLEFYSPNHPSVVALKRQIELSEELLSTAEIKNLAVDLETADGEPPSDMVLVEMALKLRPDLKVKAEISAGVVILKGSEQDVRTIKRLMKSLEWMTNDNDAKKLKREYELAERNAARVGERLRQGTASETDDKKINELKAQLRQHVREAFDLRVILQELQLEEAQAEIEEAQRRLKRRKQASEQIIERRMDEIAEGKDVSWLGGTELKETDVARDFESSPASGKPSRSTVTVHEFVDTALGLHLSGEPVLVKVGQDTYKGLRIKDVLDDQSAAQLRIRKDDILIGVHIWQTTAQNDLSFLRTARRKGDLPDHPRIYIVRDGRMLYGEVAYPPATAL